MTKKMEEATTVRVNSYYAKSGEYIQFLDDGTVLRYSGDSQRWQIDEDNKKEKAQILERTLKTWLMV